MSDKTNLDLLYQIDTNFLINYIADLIVENDDTVADCIVRFDRTALEDIIERYIY